MTLDTTHDPRNHAEEVYRRRSDSDFVAQTLDACTPHEIVQIMMHLHGTGGTGSEVEALRESASGLLQVKLFSQLIRSLDRLTSSTKRLTIAGWALTICVGVIGIVVTVVLATGR